MKIKINLEYKNNLIFGFDGTKDFCEEDIIDEKIRKLIEKVKMEYNSCYIDNNQEFIYVGYKSNEKLLESIEDIKKIKEYLLKTIGKNNEIIDEATLFLKNELNK